MALKLGKYRKHKVALIVFGICTVIVLVLAIFVNNYWSPILANKVKSVVLTSSDSLYRVDFSDAELHVLRGTIIFYNVTLKPDTAVYNRRLKTRLAPNNLVELHLKRLTLEHIHPFKLYFQNKLEIGNIILSQPDVHLSYQLNHKTDTLVKNNQTPWQKISKSLHSIHIGNIILSDIKLKYDDHSGNKVEVSELKEMSLSARDLLIDSTTQFDKTRLLYCREIIAELHNYQGKTPSGLYSYKINHLQLSTSTSKLNVEGFTLEPINTGAFFSKSKKDKYTVSVDSLQLDHFDYLSYHKYRTFSATVLSIKNGSVALFNNPNKKKDPDADKITSFPTVALNILSTDLRLDTIKVKGVNVAYSEFNEKSGQTGTLQFNNTSGSFINVTNDKAALAKSNVTQVHLTTWFMGRGKLNVFFTFNLTDNSNPYSYKGKLGPMDLRAINPAVMPLAMVKITSGTLKELNFDIKADKVNNRGSFSMLYNDAKVRLLAVDTTFGLKGKFIASVFANLFILKHDNPDKPGEPPRTFNVNYVRPQNSPFFRTLWQTLLSGIKPSVGLDKHTVSAVETQMTEHEINKQARVAKRALRKQKRAERRAKKAAEKGN